MSWSERSDHIEDFGNTISRLLARQVRGGSYIANATISSNSTKVIVAGLDLSIKSLN
jgi:hypothetical protein